MYFGYGSNMWRDQMVRRCPQSEFLGIAYLADWKWIIGERGYATIVRSPGDKVYGLVYHLSKSDEESLDGYERVPEFYVKEYHPVIFLGKKNLAVEVETEMLIYIDVEKMKEGGAEADYIYRTNKAIADAENEGVPKAYIGKYIRLFIPKQ